MLVTEAAMAPPAQPLVGLLVLPDILQLPVFVHLKQILFKSHLRGDRGRGSR